MHSFILAGLANASLSVRLIAETLWTNFWQCSQNRRLSSPGIFSQLAEHCCLIVQGDVFDSTACGGYAERRNLLARRLGRATRNSSVIGASSEVIWLSRLIPNFDGE